MQCTWSLAALSHNLSQCAPRAIVHNSSCQLLHTLPATHLPRLNDETHTEASLAAQTQPKVLGNPSAQQEAHPHNTKKDTRQ